jgi:D-alanine-D-alanine ligase-like ATP-grasp enzyme
MVQHNLADIRRELEVMTAVVRIVGTLEQPAARERVIRWAAEKFQIDIAATPPLGSVGAPIDHENSREEAIYDRETPAAAEQVRGKEPLDAIVQEIAADLQRLALGAHDA